MQFHFHANQSHFHKNGFALKTRFETEAQGNSEMAYSVKKFKFHLFRMMQKREKMYEILKSKQLIQHIDKYNYSHDFECLFNPNCQRIII